MEMGFARKQRQHTGKVAIAVVMALKDARRSVVYVVLHAAAASL